jgi:hypothetical protein
MKALWIAFSIPDKDSDKLVECALRWYADEEDRLFPGPGHHNDILYDGERSPAEAGSEILRDLDPLR